MQMTHKQPRPARASRLAFSLVAASALWGGLSCLDRPIGSPPPVITNQFVDTITQTAVDKIDLLFMIDSSLSMADKQQMLEAAVPDLVSRLVNPVCIATDGTPLTAPAAGQDCPQGSVREFPPLADINIAVITSSMGDAGANDACLPSEAENREVRVDKGRTVGSLDRWRGRGTNEFGFLEWRAGATDLDDFNDSFRSMVTAVGENGCGLEASLESWYHFLIDPFPYAGIVDVPCDPAVPFDAANRCVQVQANPDGTPAVDQTLLAQRAAFLRPDSLVAIIMLSDENDCSIKVGGDNWRVASVRDGAASRLYRSSTACDTNPNDACCYSCAPAAADARPASCGAIDPVCQAGLLEEAADDSNLRCFDQKRRFGVDFLYPTQRYVNALRLQQFCWENDDLSPENCPSALRTNPLYTGVRTPDLVFLGGIVGVPHQSIQATVDPEGTPYTPEQLGNQLRFKTAAEMNADGTWDRIVGAPGLPASDGQPGIAPTAPTDPFMVESPFPRPGIPTPNAINGREFAPTGEDLQFSCIFPLPEQSRDCSVATGTGCDCTAQGFNTALCEQRPGESEPSTTQYWAKAFPGRRQLQVLRDYGDNSIVASVCARNVSDLAAEDYGYRPAIAAIVDRLKDELGDRCLPRNLLADPETGIVPCNLVEVSVGQTSCACDPNIARTVPVDEVRSVVFGQLREDGRCGPQDPDCNSACLCEVQQVIQWASAAGVDPAAALNTCQNSESATGVEGWCYIADTDDQSIGNGNLVANCPATQRRLLRFVGSGLQPNTTTYVACSGGASGAQEVVVDTATAAP